MAIARCANAAIAVQFVCVDHAADCHVGDHERLQRRLALVRDNGGNQIAATLDSAENDRQVLTNKPPRTDENGERSLRADARLTRRQRGTGPFQ